MGSSARPKGLWLEACSLEIIDFVLIVLAIVSGFILIITGSIVMREHLASRDFQPARCSYLKEWDHGRTSCQYCYTTHTRFADETRSVRRCETSHFRCVEIVVGYMDAEGRNRTGTLYRTSITLHDQSTEQRCSYLICNRWEENNNRAVEKFVQPWRNVRAPSTATCFYHPEDTRQVITVKVYNYTQAMHSVWWPTGFFFLALICLIGRCCFRYCRAYEFHKEQVRKWAGRDVQL